jgi:hypothetical protein
MAKATRAVTWTAVKQMIAAAPALCPPATLSWSAAEDMVRGAYEDAQPRREMHWSALEESMSALNGLGEPLLVDLGSHRWLDHARGKSYSDWLAWTLDQLGTPDDVFHVLDLRTIQL